MPSNRSKDSINIRLDLYKTNLSVRHLFALRLRDIGMDLFLYFYIQLSYFYQHIIFSVYLTALKIRLANFYFSFIGSYVLGLT